MTKRLALIAFRVSRGYTQMEFARKIGFNACHLSQIETGKHPGGPKFWEAVKTAFGLTPEEVDTLRFITAAKNGGN